MVDIGFDFKSEHKSVFKLLSTNNSRPPVVILIFTRDLVALSISSSSSRQTDQRRTNNVVRPPTITMNSPSRPVPSRSVRLLGLNGRFSSRTMGLDMGGGVVGRFQWRFVIYLPIESTIFFRSSAKETRIPTTKWQDLCHRVSVVPPPPPSRPIN